MASSAGTEARRYPARTRDTADKDAATNAGQVSKNGTANRNTRQQQGKRIPALTTSRTFGAKSPVADAQVNIQAFLAACMSPARWEKYTEEEKVSIINSLPATRRPRPSAVLDSVDGDGCEQNTGSPVGECFLQPPLTSEFCNTDPYLKRGIARFKRDLENGYYEKAWLNRAIKAHEERIEGKFDEYLQEHAEEMFAEDDHAENDMDELADESEDGEYMDCKRNKGQKSKSQEVG